MIHTKPNHELEQPLEEDAELIKSAQQGNLEAFTSLYQRYLPLVYNRVCYLIPEADVEDVTQEVFIALLRSLKSFRAEAQFSTWLRTLTNRRIADYYRQRRHRETQSDSETGQAADNAAAQTQSRLEAGETDNRLALRQAIRALDEPHREIVLMRFADGLSFQEIARVRGQSLEATKSLFRRAIAAIRRQVEEDLPDAW